MKKRKWVLFLFIFIVAALMVLLQGWRVFKANERLEYYIQNQLRPVLGKQFDISKVHVGFGNIHIQGIHVPLEDNDILIEIHDLVLGYNVLNLIIPGFKPAELSNNIQFLNPVVTFKRTPLAGRRSAGSPSDSLVSVEQVLLNFEPIQHLKRITIKKGIIQWAQDDTTYPVIRSLDGAIYREKQSELVLRGKGSLFNSMEKNILAEGRIDLETGHFLHTSFNVDDYNLQNGIDLLDPEQIELNEGLLDADLQWTPQKSPNQSSLSGTFNIRGGDFTLQSGRLHFQNTQTSGEIQGSDVSVKSEQIVNGAAVSLKGHIYQVFDPVFDLDVTVRDFDPQRFEAVFPDDISADMQGVLRANGKVTGFNSDIALSGIVSAAKFTVSGVELDDLTADVTYRKKELFIKSSRGRCNGVQLDLNGSIDFNSPRPKLSASFESLGDIAPLLNPMLPEPLVSLNTLLSAELSGTLNRPLILGTIGCSLYSQTMDSVYLHSAFSYYNKKARIHSLEHSETLNLQAMVDFSGELLKYTFKGDSIANAVYAVLNLPATSKMREQYDFSVDLTGDEQQFDAGLTVVRRGTGQFLSLAMNAETSATGWVGSGKLSLYPDTINPLIAEYALEKTASQFRLTQLSIENQLFSRLSVNLNDSLRLNGVVKTFGLELNRILGDSLSGFTAKTDSDLMFSGTLFQPVVQGDISIQKMFFNDRGPYGSTLSFTWEPDKLSIRNFMLNTETATLLIAGGSMSTDFEDLDIWLKGAGFDLRHVWFAADQKEFPVSGKTFIDLAVKGSRTSPEIRGRVGLKEGDIYGIPFDELELNVMDSRNAAHGVALDSFRLTRFDRYELSGNGFFPFAASDSMRFELKGDGNLLFFLSDITEFVKDPSADCSLNVHVSGTPQNPLIDQAELSIRDGRVNFANVIAPVRDLSAQISFDPENRYVDLEHLKGKMGESPFEIHNEPVEQIDSKRPLENITIPGPDLNLGALVVHSKEPLPLNIQGLMEPGEFGRLQFAGRAEGENMIVAACEGGYILSGMIYLSHSQIMFPFYERENNKKTGVHQFFENLFWDVKVVPMENNWFSRNYSGAIDEVYVNIMLDENFGGLEFTGRLADDTFRINGELRSTSGFVEYLDMSFMVEQFGVQFDRSSMIPITYGRAKTTVTDSLGITSNIYLTLQTVDTTVTQDNFGDRARQESSRGRFNKIRFKLTSDNPNVGVSEAQIMSSLGYSASNLQNSALSAFGYSTDNILFRPLFRPLERELEKTLGLDYVRFSSQLTKNILNYNLNNTVVLNDRLLLLESTRVIVGKYLANRFFLQYTGQIESGIGYRYREKALGLHHTLGLEFRISPQVLLELEYDYDSLMLYNRQDARIVLRHWFPF
ncbi:MAG: translocation/assembly module TamB domain-containing protein [candidate division KSB1 bacterium]|nr:translocation/assembly module TamB domain-containing protein [candidate division KSB1 bacterium]